MHVYEPFFSKLVKNEMKFETCSTSMIFIRTLIRIVSIFFCYMSCEEFFWYMNVISLSRSDYLSSFTPKSILIAYAVQARLDKPIYNTVDDLFSILHLNCSSNWHSFLVFDRKNWNRNVSFVQCLNSMVNVIQRHPGRKAILLLFSVNYIDFLLYFQGRKTSNWLNKEAQSFVYNRLALI
jgi:hypothetical protein